jgi:hypothetical protein
MNRGQKIFLCLAAAIVAYQAILPPVVAVANNGDFGKVTGRFGIWPRHEGWNFASATLDIQPDRRWKSGFFSTENALARAALALNGLFSKDAGSFDLRWIGIVHGALWLLALWLFTPLLSGRPPKVQAAVYALLLSMLCDVMYVGLLNSFYMDEAAHIFLLLAVAAYLRVLCRRRGGDLVFAVICALALTTSKGQHAPLGVWFALLLLATRPMFPGWKRRVLDAAAFALILVAALMLWKSAPPDYTLYSYYNVTFLEILPDSKNLAGTMKDLDLDPSYVRCIGKNAFDPASGMSSEEFRRSLARKLSLGKLGRFYLKHPSDAYRTMRNGLALGGRQRFGAGNFDMSAGFPPYTESNAFSLWSGFKCATFFGRGGLYMACIAGLAAIFLSLLIAGRSMLPAGSVLAGFALLGMELTELGATLADAAEMDRHLLVSFAIFDIMLIAVFYLVTAHVGARRLSRPFRLSRLRSPATPSQPDWAHSAHAGHLAGQSSGSPARSHPPA